MADEREWRIERNEPVRDDAPGIFVPVTDLPDAAVGDRVVVPATDDGAERRGVIAEQTSRGDERYFRVDLEPPIDEARAAE